MAQLPDREVPFDEVRAFFERTHPKTWRDFEKELERYRADTQTPRVDDGWIDLLIDIARHYEQVLRPFPDTAEGLERDVNEQFEQMHSDRGVA